MFIQDVDWEIGTNHMEGIASSILPTPHIEHETMIILYLHEGSSNSSLLP